MPKKSKETSEEQPTRTRVSDPDAPRRSREDKPGRPGRLLSAQNQILSKLAAGCAIPELMSDVADYVKAFAPTWEDPVGLF